MMWPWMNNVHRLLFIALIWIFMFCTSGEQETTWGSNSLKKYDGYQLFHLTPKSDLQLNYLRNLMLNDTSLHVDFWTEPGVPGKTVDLMVAPESLATFREDLDRLQMEHNVVMRNVQDAIELEQEARKFSGSFLRDSIGGSGSGSTFSNAISLTRYNSYDSIQRFMRQAEARYPNLAKVHPLRNRDGNIAKTHDGRTLELIQITGNVNSGAKKPAFWLDGGIHAREWIAVSIPVYTINRLLTTYNTDPEVKRLVDQVDWYILPVVNPDGYEYSRNYDRMWRKNRNPNNYQRFSYCWGVDLNRNFDWSFGGEGSSRDVCQETYRGTHAFSEPESEAVSLKVKQLQSRLKAFITFHSYSQVWMYPFGHKRNTKARDWRDLARVAKKATAKLKGYYGRNYIVDTGANALYPAAGGSDDWAKGKVGVKYVYLVELRPSDNGREANAYGFILPESQILPTSRETFGALLEVAGEVAAMSSRSVTRPTQGSSFIVRPAMLVKQQSLDSQVNEQSSETIIDTSQEQNGPNNIIPVNSNVQSSVPAETGAVVPLKECVDLRGDCEYWKSRKRCNWFSRQCQKTCEAC